MLDRHYTSAFLARAGLDVHAQYGDWDGSPFVATSPEIITIVRQAGSSG